MPRLLGESDGPRAIYGAAEGPEPARHRARRTAAPQAAFCTRWESGAQGGGRRCSGNAQISPATPARAAGSWGEFCAARWSRPECGRGCSCLQGRWDPGRQQCPETDLFKWSLRGTRQGGRAGGRRKEPSSLGEEIEGSGKFEAPINTAKPDCEGTVMQALFKRLLEYGVLTYLKPQFGSSVLFQKILQYFSDGRK